MKSNWSAWASLISLEIDVQENQDTFGIVQITCALLLAVLIGWLVVVGKSLLLPILIGIIAVYILTATANKMQHFPLLRGLSQSGRRALAGGIFLLAIVLLVGIVTSNAQAISDAIPGYASNFNKLAQNAADFLGLKSVPNFSKVVAQIEKNLDISSLLTNLLGGLTGAGTFLFSALLYGAFLLADWDELPQKTRVAFRDSTTADVALKTASAINSRIGDYLAAKTLINLILGAVSFVVMWLIGIEFALFWAMLIALLNYIPYVGSILGVFFPVTLALLQFGGMLHAGTAFIALMAAQLFVGNILEPKILGKSVNMSSFVFMVALSFWMTVWGVIGAIMAIPLTAMIMIILAEIPRTRPIAVMMSGDGNV